MSIRFPSSRKEIETRAKVDVQSQLENANPFLKNSFLGALITGVSGRIYEFYLQLQNALFEMFPDTATGAYLERWGSYVAINRNPATQATGTVIFTGTVTSVIPAATTLSSSDGLTYTTDLGSVIAANLNSVSTMTRSGTTVTVTTAGAHYYATGITVTIAGAVQTDYNGAHDIVVTGATTFTFTVSTTPASPATGTITATANTASTAVTSTDFGVLQNQVNGTELTLNVGIAGVDNDVGVFYDGLTGGSDVEGDVAYRARVLFRYQNPIALFNVNAIKSKVFEQSGITRVWVREAGESADSNAITSITRSGQVATVTTTNVHGLETGQTIRVAGAAQSQYNIYTKCFVISDYVFHYLVEGSPATPATGTCTYKQGIAPGQVRVLFMRDNDAYAVPDAGEILAAKERIRTIKPAHMYVDDILVVPPDAAAIHFTFTELTPNTTAMKTAITAALQALFSEETEPGVPLHSAAYLSAIWQALSEAGEQVESFTLSVPSGTIALVDDQIGILGTITYP